MIAFIVYPFKLDVSSQSLKGLEPKLPLTAIKVC